MVLQVTKLGHTSPSHFWPDAKPSTAQKTHTTVLHIFSTSRPPLDWAQVSRYSLLEEFNLLRNTQRDISDRPWAQLVARETIKKYMRVCRAREELTRCNIEARRLTSYPHIYPWRGPPVQQHSHDLGKPEERPPRAGSGVLRPPSPCQPPAP